MTVTAKLVEALQAANRLETVRKPVAPARDLAAVDRGIFETLHKASLFETTSGFPGWRVAGNLLADREFWTLALDLPESQLLSTLRKRMSAPLAPVQVGARPIDTVSERLDLKTIPLPLRAERDGAPLFAAIATTIDPRDASDALAMVQLKPLGHNRLALIDMPPALQSIHDQYILSGRTMPVALSVGAEPALYLAAALAQGLRRADLSLAGGLNGRAIDIVTVNGVPAPAHVEYVMAGEVSTQSPPPSHANSTLIGTYAAPQTMHVVTASEIHRQKNPVHWAVAPATVLALATELLLLDHIQNIEGGLDIVDIRCLPVSGSLIAFVKLRPRVQGQAKTALLGCLSGAAYWVKLAIAVDEDTDTSSIRDVLWSIASRTHAKTDIDVINGLRALHADPMARPVQEGQEAERFGARWFIDSTMPALSQPDSRKAFRRAIPKNFEAVSLADYRLE